MTQNALVALLLCEAAVFYLVCGCLIVRSMTSAGGEKIRGLAPMLVTAIVSQAAALSLETWLADEVRFGFGVAVGVIFLIANVIFFVESLIRRVSPLQGAFLLVASVAAVLPFVMPGQVVSTEKWTPLFVVHLLLALTSYAFMLIAALQSVFLVVQDNWLKNPAKAESAFIASMPSLLATERIMYRIVMLGFVCLSVVLVTGCFVTHEWFGEWIRFDHKTLLTWGAWVAFGVLMGGRYFLGWRRRKALFWFWGGTMTLLVAYLVYRIVLDFSL